MKLIVANSCEDYTSYRASRTKSLFNVDSGANFNREFELPGLAKKEPWTIGVVVGPSGTGKSSIARLLAKKGWEVWDGQHEWPTDVPIIDAIDPEGDYDGATAALASVGLGDVPSWLRPHHVLSNGERFRADLARILSEQGTRVIIDEFSSVVDRQVARVGAGAFAKSWRRGNTGARKAILLTCHQDVLEWIDPDWVLNTEDGELAPDTRGQFLRGKIDVAIEETGWGYWPLFKPHHYLADAGPMPFSTAFVAFVGDEPVAHLGMSALYIGRKREARACRMVVMPEWQGAGIGMRFLNAMVDRELRGEGFVGHKTQAMFHTNHPALTAALRRDNRWRQISYRLYGDDKPKMLKRWATYAEKHGDQGHGRMGWGGHFRGVQGFRYFGQAGIDAAAEHGRGQVATRKELR